MTSTIKTVESYEPRQILAISTGDEIRLPATLPADAGDVEAGQVMGLRTSDGLLLPVRRCLLAADAADDATTINVGAANVGKFKVGDTVHIMKLDRSGDVDLGAVTAIGAATITVTNATGAAFTKDQAYVYVADGTEKAVAIMEYTCLSSAAAHYFNGAAVQHVSPYISGTFYESELIGMDTVAISDLGARRTLGGLIVVPS